MTTKDQVLDKQELPIKEGDEVFTPFRGGKHEGKVDKIVLTEEDARKEGVKHPPKVLFTDQHGHHVSHNPGTLSHVKNKE